MRERKGKNKLSGKNRDVLEQTLDKYNPVLSSRDHRLEYLIDNPESEPFPHTEEDHSYDRVGL
ncbi:hypothetical protein [Fonticella tunisiensis]|uniref:Uncharacterized protein n=1 Tax=Fonticella tunisiensis TaxID=1096341 RepID=A0A4R7KBJ7_9CLOT|nr:hypothetical protein [Fonticella tunisiensis]TDT51358.1 hypothetical protein EDD71_11842 [Fonticella tunisiensis]